MYGYGFYYWFDCVWHMAYTCLGIQLWNYCCKKLGYDTAKAVLNAPREVLIEKADLEEDTVDHLLEVLKAEFENEE